MKPALHIVSTPRDPLAEAQAAVDAIAVQEARAFETALCDLVEQAQRIAGADAIRSPGVREIARQAAVANRTLALNLGALNQRSTR